MSMRFALLAFGALATPAAAQVAPVPAATPTPTATIPAEASAVPPPLSVTLPTPVAVPTPVVRPTPAATAPAPRPTATPRIEATPRPEATPTPRAASTPTPTPTTTPSATTNAAPPAPVATPTATAPSPVVAGAQPAEALPIPPERGSAWTLPTVGGLLVAVALVALVVRRRRRRGDPVPDEVEPVAAPDPAPRPAAPAAVPVAPQPALARAWLAVEVRPRRAGVNLLTATLDAELVVRNDGEAAAEDIRVALHLLSARAGQDAELAQVFEAPAARPVTAPFALAPGAERVLSAIATLPRGEIAVLSVGDRPMFVPLAAVAVRYRSGEIEGLTAGAFALGIEREGAAKLAPFRLDQPTQMHERVAVRPHAPAIRR